MARYIKTIGSSAFLLFLMLTWNGCDQFNTLPLNIPFTMKVAVEGSEQTLSNSTNFCLSTDSQTYDDYKDKIKSLHFIEAAFRTLSVSPSDITGNITVSLQDGNGTTLFSYAIPGVNPSDYMKPNSPYILQLTQAQIDFINTYLSNVLNSGACFTATITVDNLTGNPPYSIKGAIDMVIEAETEL